MFYTDIACSSYTFKVLVGEILSKEATICFYFTRPSSSSALQTCYYNVTINLKLNLIKVQHIIFSTTTTGEEIGVSLFSLEIPRVIPSHPEGHPENCALLLVNQRHAIDLLCLQRDISIDTTSPLYFYLFIFL